MKLHELIIYGVVLAVAILLGVVYLVPALTPPSQPVSVQYYTSLPVTIDPLTGCHYLTSYGFTPRLDADGRQICEPLP